MTRMISPNGSHRDGFCAFLDTCVLFPMNLRDVILTIAEVGVCQIQWSPDILDELERTYI